MDRQASATAKIGRMDYKDYYKVMGVARDASQDEIKRVYRRLARKYHPDVSKEANAEEKFKEVQEAYEVLKDPEKRAAYDQLGSQLALRDSNSRRRPTGATDFEFSTSHGAAAREDGGLQRFLLVAVRRAQSVRQQRGGGGRAAALHRRAKITPPRSRSISKTRSAAARRRSNCKSPQLGEDGRVAVKPRTLKVTIPAGVIEGQQIRLAGQGSAGIGGGPPGDLYLEIGFKPHRLFQVEGRDITLTLPVAPWEAALGATVQTPTLAGPVELRIPPEREGGSETAAQGSRPAGADTRRSVRRAEDRAAAGRHTAARAKSTSRCSEELPFDPRAELRDVIDQCFTSGGRDRADTRRGAGSRRRRAASR